MLSWYKKIFICIFGNHLTELDTRDVNELLLADVDFQKGGRFRVGYDAGNTPAGRLCVYASFDNTFEISEDLIYETY
ncbi:hypothetical protein [Paenibacillus pabuli]|uniref:hypothetical protein n=1 Tax=Paenibacillus pabuli TaxID=1472 RepID=UPI003CECBA6E